MARVLFSSAVVGLLVLANAGPADAQPQAPGAAPHHGLHPGHRVPEPELADPAAGRQLFQAKGCVACHAVKGQGGTVGPDLGRIDHGHNAYQMAGIMWNHSTHMRVAMTERGIARPRFSGHEMADLLAYLQSLEVLGDPEKGREVFDQKGCVRCHSVAGEGGRIGPPLVPSHHPHPPIELAGVMWNHSPTMSAVMEAMKIPRPVFEGNEMADLLAYLEAAQGRASETPPMHRRGSPAPDHHR